MPQRDGRVGPASWYWPARYKVLAVVLIVSVYILLFIVLPGGNAGYPAGAP